MKRSRGTVILLAASLLACTPSVPDDAAPAAQPQLEQGGFESEGGWSFAPEDSLGFHRDGAAARTGRFGARSALGAGASATVVSAPFELDGPLLVGTAVRASNLAWGEFGLRLLDESGGTIRTHWSDFGGRSDRFTELRFYAQPPAGAARACVVLRAFDEPRYLSQAEWNGPPDFLVDFDDVWIQRAPTCESVAQRDPWRLEVRMAAAQAAEPYALAVTRSGREVLSLVEGWDHCVPLARRSTVQLLASDPGAEGSAGTIELATVGTFRVHIDAERLHSARIVAADGTLGSAAIGVPEETMLSLEGSGLALDEGPESLVVTLSGPCGIALRQAASGNSWVLECGSVEEDEERQRLVLRPRAR